MSKVKDIVTVIVTIEVVKDYPTVTVDFVEIKEPVLLFSVKVTFTEQRPSSHVYDET